MLFERINGAQTKWKSSTTTRRWRIKQDMCKVSWVDPVDEKVVHSGERVHEARSMNIGSEKQALVWSERDSWLGKELVNLSRKRMPKRTRPLWRGSCRSLGEACSPFHMTCHSRRFIQSFCFLRLLLSSLGTLRHASSRLGFSIPSSRPPLGAGFINVHLPPEEWTVWMTQTHLSIFYCQFNKLLPGPIRFESVREGSSSSQGNESRFMMLLMDLRRFVPLRCIDVVLDGTSSNMKGISLSVCEHS